MIELPPKSYVDTQILINAASGKIAESDWHRCARYLKETTRYCVSSLTLMELLAALARSDERYFEQHQKRLRILLAPSDNPEVFDFIPYFTAKVLGFQIERPSHLEDDFLGTVRLILSAPSKASLEGGFSPDFSPDKTARVRLDRLADEVDRMHLSYIAHMQRLREVEGNSVAPSDWVTSLLGFYGVTNASEDLKRRTFESLSASYEFEMSVRNFLRNGNFKIETHTSDLVDGQQLIYLCDSSTIFITDDSDFKNRVQNSPQASRIKSLSDILVCERQNAPLTS